MLLMPLLLGIWLINLLLSVKLGEAKSLLSLHGGTKGGLSLMLVVSLSVRGELPSRLTCFHEEVDVRVVLLGTYCVFRRGEWSYGECLGEETELAEIVV